MVDPAASYDETPYTGHPKTRTHPDRLATMATLLGLSPPSPRRCRVLELGCGDGGNLLPLAERLPESEFVGIDASAVQIDDGCRTAEAVGLKNVALRQGDIMTIGPEWGRFDYIIVHGVYSWVPPVVQEKILEICSTNLSADGVAYVSYNTFPGWKLRGIVRDLMVFAGREIRDHRERLARARGVIEEITKVAPPDSIHGRILQIALEHMGGQRDYYLLHEYLEDDNAPVYFSEFAARAGKHGLQFLCEANSLDISRDGRFPAAAAQLISQLAKDVIEVEQYADFVTGEMFRETLLCHADRKIDRPVRAERVNEFHLMGLFKTDVPNPDLRSTEPLEFGAPSSSISTTTPLLKAVFYTMGERWPEPMRLSDLLAEARRLIGQTTVDESDDRDIAEMMLRCFIAGKLDLRLDPPAVTARPGRRPIASPLARHQAASGRPVTNLRHETVAIDGVQRYLVPLLDGAHDRTWLLDRLLGGVQAGQLELTDRNRRVTDAAAARRLLGPMLDRAVEHLAMTIMLTKDEGGEFHAKAS